MNNPQDHHPPPDKHSNGWKLYTHTDIQREDETHEGVLIHSLTRPNSLSFFSILCPFVLNKGGGDFLFFLKYCPLQGQKPEARFENALATSQWSLNGFISGPMAGWMDGWIDGWVGGL